MLKIKATLLWCSTALFFLPLASSPKLLPEQMLFTQRLVWGEQGLMRATNLVPLSPENRMRETGVRNSLFLTHRILGYMTSGAMLATGITGWQVADGNHRLEGAHKTLLTTTNIGYFTGLSVALFAPPPGTNQQGTPLALHRILSVAHLAGMITTDVLGDNAKNHPNPHRIAAIATFATYALSSIVIHF
jgi:hypothetical protein